MRAHPNLVAFDDLPADIAAFDTVLAAKLTDWVRTSRTGVKRTKKRNPPLSERPEDRAAVEAAGIGHEVIELG